jgi:hypothetical protein
MVKKPKVAAMWSSLRAKYWLELIENADGSFEYRHDHGGGFIGEVTREQADARMQEELSSYASDGIKMIAR